MGWVPFRRDKPHRPPRRTDGEAATAAARVAASIDAERRRLETQARERPIRTALRLAQRIDRDVITLPCDNVFHSTRQLDVAGRPEPSCPWCHSTWWALDDSHQPELYILAAVLRAALDGIDITDRVHFQ